MARTVVSAARLRSMLANRHKTAEQVAADVSTRASLAALVRQDAEVDFEDLQAIAKYFKKPWSYLLLDAEEQFPDLGHDNRTYANQQVPVSPDLIAEYEAVLLMLDAAIELFPDERYQVPAEPITTRTDATIAATRIRALLGVSIDDQIAAKDEYSALRLWIAALHQHGVYVSQRRLRDPTIRAFSAARDGQAVIVVDTGDPPYARIFSLLHEYCHVVLRSTGICDLEQHSTVERYCNETAAAILLPAELVRRELGGIAFGGDDAADDNELRRLSHRLGVSQAALLIELHRLGVIGDETYEAMEARRLARRAAGRKGRGQFYPTAINKVGRRFARNVFDALADEAIDRADAGVLLGVGEHLVGRFRRELHAAGDGGRP